MTKKLPKAAWSSDAENYLIDLIEKNPCIWKVNHALYQKQNAKRAVFEKITRLVKNRYIFQLQHLTTDDLIVKYNNMKFYYRRLKRLETGAKPDGGGADNLTPKWEHFHRLSFLDRRMDCETGSTSSESSDQTDSKVFVINADQNSDASKTPDNVIMSCKPLEANTIILQPQQYSTVLRTPSNFYIVNNSIEAATTPFPINFYPSQNELIAPKVITGNIPEKSTETFNNLSPQENSLPAKHLSVPNNNLTAETLTTQNIFEETLRKLGLQENPEDKAFYVYVLSLLQSVEDVNFKRRIHMGVIQLIQDRLEMME